MYSLYRAWLSLNPLPTLPIPPLNLTSVPEAPDVSLHVGPSMTHFSAHRGVLTAHSGFFKAALSNNEGNNNINLQITESRIGLAPIAVPNVNVDEFSSLLTFMYTGCLDLNITNIYSILLATHILHMPRALEMCRSFLLQQGYHSPDVQKVNIIKPIACRKLTPSMKELFNQPPIESTTVKIADQEQSSSFTKASSSKSVSTASNVVAEKKNKQKKPAVPPAKDMSTIIDVACCDGPVRFHRVLNKNYGIDSENLDTTGKLPNFSAVQSSIINKALNENLMEKIHSDEQTNELFTCVYCNHTFKSQYCYQKHARRHLYPVDKNPESKREVKLLDMNVQYYPCKTCGSKFPSYYFVHKHRKMCHAEEVADKNNKNNEIVMENASASVNQEECSSSSSAIDVEAIQNDTEPVS